MNQKDKILKECMQVVNTSKDFTKNNILKAVQEKKLKIDHPTLNMLMDVINSSIDQGFHVSVRQFEIAVDSVLTQSKNPISQEDIRKKNNNQ